MIDALGERRDLLEQLLAAARTLRRDVGARQVEQVGHVWTHLAMEAAHGAVGPLLAVLVRAQVMLDEETDRLAFIAREVEPRVDLVEHARADLGVTVKMQSVG